MTVRKKVVVLVFACTAARMGYSVGSEENIEPPAILRVLSTVYSNCRGLHDSFEFTVSNAH